MSQPVAGHVSPAATADLQAALEQALSQHFGAQCAVAWLERRPAPCGSSFALEELDVRLAGTTLQLMFKDLSPRALLASARNVKPAFLYEPCREIEVYRQVLARHRLGTATCYGSVVEERLGRYWLFLERVPGVELYQVGEFAIWQQAAGWLAELHTCLAAEAGRLASLAPLLTYDGDFYRQWPRRARAFQKAGPNQRGLEWLAGRYERVVERLVALPVTFLHGEFYASNVLVQQTVLGPRVCPVDWEMAAVGPGLMDLADLTAGKWSEEQKASLALAYHQTLAELGGCPPPSAGLLGALDYCRLHRAVQWLGWSPQWLPPTEHAQDWLGEALSLAEKLGL
jgi:aminoglycoside phosphotransferase (APT) family kinase protein